MDKNLVNISKIETYLNSIFDNVVSNNTFFGEVPSTEMIDPSWEDMVFIEMPNGIKDMDAYAYGTAIVWLYAKPLSSGRKNVAKMSQMEAKLNDVLASVQDKTYLLNRRETYTSFDTSIKWHCNAVEIIVKVF